MKVHFTEKDHTDIINLYTGGMYAKDIAKKYNVSGETILRILKKHNIEIKRYIRKSQFSKKHHELVIDINEKLWNTNVLLYHQQFVWPIEKY